MPWQCSHRWDRPPRLEPCQHSPSWVVTHRLALSLEAAVSMAEAEAEVEQVVDLVVIMAGAEVEVKVVEVVQAERTAGIVAVWVGTAETRCAG